MVTTASTAPEPAHALTRRRQYRGHRSALALWLFATAALVFLMIVVGGLTRLTESGLSIVEWQPLRGAIPPLSTADWEQEFALYQASPEYQLVNQGMSLDAFKRIFWMEYGHRLLGRVIGVVFFLPFLYFAIRGLLTRREFVGFSLLFLLGALQGLLGWYMVKSGLVDNPHVSQYRLCAHLLLAIVLYAGLLWSALSVLHSDVRQPRDASTGVGLGVVLIVVFFLLIGSGGLMAGTRAGSVYNTFPLIAGSLWPDEIARLVPAWRNVFENVVTIQVQHRFLAALTLLLSIYVFVRCRTELPHVRKWSAALVVVVIFQFGLGVATLLTKAPLTLAAMHQAVAVLAFTVAVIFCHGLRYDRVA